MLERFHVPDDQQIRVHPDALRTTVTALFEACGVPPDDAATGADLLVTNDLHGVETHGVSNMLRRYIGWYRDGSLNPTPDWRVLREMPGTATIDGDGGLGVIQGPQAMRLAMAKARDVGIGVVVVRNSEHLGGTGYHALLAARNDMVGMSMTASRHSVLPTFGAVPRIGTNPLAIAAPARAMPPLLFDVATSTVAGNKIGLAQRLGIDLEPGWIARRDGTLVMERAPAPPPGQYHLLPLGGTREQGSHKGYGLALMVETLGSVLAGSIPSMLAGPGDTTRSTHYFAAYDIAAFTDLDQFKDTMDAMLRALVDTPPAPGHDRVLYPGLLEHEAEQERLERGIPLHPEVVEWFDRITAELGVAGLVR